MKLYLSFEQEAMVAGLVEGARVDQLRTGYVTVADGDLYDGPGAKAPPGNVLAYIGPIDDFKAEEALRQTADLLRKLGNEVLRCGVDY